MSRKEAIDKLLVGREYLKCIRVYNCTLKDITKILNMEEWNNSDYNKLLTKSIWNIPSYRVKRTFNNPLFKSNKYKFLYDKEVFNIDLYNDNVINLIHLYEEYGIIDYITIDLLKKDYNEMKLILESLNDNLIVFKDNKYILNPVIYNKGSNYEIKKLKK